MENKALDALLKDIRSGNLEKLKDLDQYLHRMAQEASDNEAEIVLAQVEDFLCEPLRSKVV